MEGEGDQISQWTGIDSRNTKGDAFGTEVKGQNQFSSELVEFENCEDNQMNIWIQIYVQKQAEQPRWEIGFGSYQHADGSRANGHKESCWVEQNLQNEEKQGQCRKLQNISI